jgi:hypothetical protein
MAKVLKLMQMAMCMMANGKTAKCLDKAHWLNQTAIDTLVNGEITKEMGME